MHDIALAGIFVQIGLLPNTQWLDGTVERNKLVRSWLIHVVKPILKGYLLRVTVQLFI